MKKKKQEEAKSNKLLTIVFFLLLALVILLIVLCVIRNNEYKTDGFANLSFYLNGEESPIEFSINANTLAETDEYIFKITNFKKNKINKEKLDYTVTIENTTNSVISVTVNDVGEDLMINQESTELKDTLKKDKKEAVYYHVKVSSHGELTDKDLINVRISN